MLFAVSILGADFSKLGTELADLNDAGTDWVHVDVMDGHFVPNITFGPGMVKTLRPCTRQTLDVHLMISQPQRYIKQFAEAGSDIITFHLEAEGDPAETIAMIHDCGKKAGISIKPGTPAEKLYPYLSTADMILVMTVEPGFGGQKFMPEMLEKVRLLKEKAPCMTVEIDGGVNENTVKQAAAVGVDVCVAGSAIVGKPNYKEAVQKLQNGARV